MVVKKLTNGLASHQQKLYKYYTQPIKLEKDERISGSYGWLVLFLGVLAYDTYAIKTKKIETLTRAFWRSTENPTKSIVPVGVWLLLTFHLLGEKKLRRKITEEI
jgi:hypothetical protein